MSQTSIYLVRHGKSEANHSELLGLKESPLSDQGFEQAKKLADYFNSALPKNSQRYLYTSDFKRAYQTASAFNPNKYYTEIDLGERSFGNLEKIPGQKLLKKLKKFLDSLDKEERENIAFVRDMETDKEAFDRFNSCLKKIASTRINETSLVFTHSNIMRIFLVYIGWTTFEHLPSGSIHNTAFVKLSFENGIFRVIKTRGILKI